MQPCGRTILVELGIDAIHICNESLNDQDLIVFIQYGKPRTWFFHREEKRVYRSDGRFRTGDAGQLQVAVMQHLGIAHVPFWLFQAEIEAGTVQRLLPGTEWQTPIFAVRPEGDTHSKSGSIHRVPSVRDEDLAPETPRDGGLA
jgi:DNA-binding transcriptional LysR family regulator